MSVLAAIRTGHVGVPLFFHVLGAMLLVGTLLVVGSAILLGWRREGDSVALTRYGLRTLLWGVLPAYVVMRIGAQWTESAEGFPDGYDPAWLGIGYMTADVGGGLVLISVVLSALGLRRLRGDGGTGLARAVGVIAVVLLAAYLVTVWAMAGKPS
ncbi:MAG TPA: hypothetical protein VFI37_15585 [Gaiellaceae bacterium]|jgi:hypothetical protein|nr:hypothetical protein [Gaiellaceae bacterium]